MTIATVATVAGHQFATVAGTATCHFDVAEWLEPDWVYQPHTGEFVAGRSLRRPPLDLEILRVHRSAWELFKHHHYLNTTINRTAKCFVALLWGRPAAFASVIHHIGKRCLWREHRTVCLPDFQGVGIGNALSEYVGSLFAATDKPYHSTTSSPAMIRHRLHSRAWRMIRKPGFNSQDRSEWVRVQTTLAHARATTRCTAGFRYVGHARPEDARRFGLT